MVAVVLNIPLHLPNWQSDKCWCAIGQSGSHQRTSMAVIGFTGKARRYSFPGSLSEALSVAEYYIVTTKSGVLRTLVRTRI
jgi:hypothetical protein